MVCNEREDDITVNYVTHRTEGNQTVTYEMVIRVFDEEKFNKYEYKNNPTGHVCGESSVR